MMRALRRLTPLLSVLNYWTTCGLFIFLPQYIETNLIAYLHV